MNEEVEGKTISSGWVRSLRQESLELIPYRSLDQSIHRFLILGL